MSRFSRILSLVHRWWGVPGPAAPTRPSKQVVICVGCNEDCAMLDRVLGPGEYELSFLASVDDAYSQILHAMPNRVIFCMRADDARSLQVLSMLNLDPRTTRIPIITCIPSVTGDDGGVEQMGTSDYAPARPGVVMH